MFHARFVDKNKNNKNLKKKYNYVIYHINTEWVMESHQTLLQFQHKHILYKNKNKIK